MAINIGDKKVSKIYLGDKLIMEGKQNDWIELELPPRAEPSSGNILFKDMGDGTARLYGGFTIAKSDQDSYMLCSLPEGYQFVSSKHIAMVMMAGRTLPSGVTLTANTGHISIVGTDQSLNTNGGEIKISLSHLGSGGGVSADLSPFILINYTKTN